MLKRFVIFCILFLNACTPQKPQHLCIDLSSTIQPPVLKPMYYIENDKCFLLKNSRQQVVCQTPENEKITMAKTFLDFIKSEGLWNGSSSIHSQSPLFKLARNIYEDGRLEALWLPLLKRMSIKSFVEQQSIKTTEKPRSVAWKALEKISKM